MGINKNDLRQGLKDLAEIIDSDFRQLDEKQKEFIKNKYNTYVNFEYIEDGGYIFIMNKDTFTRFEYYLGMEYDSEYIESKVVVEDTIMVTYSYDSSRAEELINTLGELSEE